MVLTRNFPLPKFSLDFEIAGSNRGPEHRLIPKYQAEPLSPAGILVAIFLGMSQSIIFLLGGKSPPPWVCHNQLSSHKYS